MRHITNKNSQTEELVQQTRMIIRIFSQNLNGANVSLQSGSAICIEQTIQNATIQAVAILAPELGNRLSDVLKSRYCRSNAAVLECFLALVLQLN